MRKDVLVTVPLSGAVLVSSNKNASAFGLASEVAVAVFP
jgi:hypothetical protein